MKTKFIISILFFLVNLFSSGQSVPNTTTFTLQNVADAVNPTTDDLIDCFNDANPAYFNSTYKNQYYTSFGLQNNLLMFRDYGPHISGCSTLPSVTQLAYTGVKTQTSIDVITAASSTCTILSRIIYYSTAHMATQSDTPFAQAITNGSITTTVTGLSPNTGYYFSVYVTNSYGTSNIQQSFKYYTSQ